jgi:hypothetical protein
MIDVLFIGDGPRDRATAPVLVEQILNVDVNVEFSDWKRLHSKGYGRKLRYAICQARDREVAGLVATLDADRAPQRQRLGELRKARDEDRENSPPLPTALGEAVPHSEAWLLDDPVAVRNALGLSAETPVPTVRQTDSPKESLNDLINQSKSVEELTVLDVLQQIASELLPARCRHDAGNLG